MDSDKDSSAVENDEAKTTFRKPTNDAANKKYRRRTPVSGSSSSDESPRRNRSSSPIRLKEDRKVSDKQSKREDCRDDRGSNRSGRNSDFHRSSFRSSQGYSRHEDYCRSGKHVDEEDRHYSRLSSRSSYSDYKERGSDCNRSRDHYRDMDKYNQNRANRAGSDGRHSRHNFDEGTHDRDRNVKDRDYRDERRDHRRRSRDHRSYEESRGNRVDISSREQSSKNLLKEAHKNDLKAEGKKHLNGEMNGEQYINRHKGTEYKDSGERLKEKATGMSENDESTAKRPNLFSLNNTDLRTDGSKQGQEILGKSAPEQTSISESAGNVDAAKVAAMKAAELVNKNLFGSGVMTADQKKKLLWGNKKTNTTEESSHRWNTAIFPDQERQEKFNKLMSLRLPWYIWPIVGCERRLQGGAQAEQQYPPSGEAERASDGFGETIYCRASAKRWSHCGFRPLVKRVFPYLPSASETGFLFDNFIVFDLVHLFTHL